MGIDLERDGLIATVTVNEPAKLNAMNTERLEALLAAFRELASDASVRAVIFTGAGDRAFIAGADIKEMVDKDPDAALAFGRLGHAVGLAIEQMPQPVIAAVNGFALGGGCELALACDLRIAADTAVFGQPEVGLGIPPGWGGTQRLTRLVGPGIAADLIFTGRRVKADEALGIGLVNAVHPAAELPRAARAVAETVAANGPLAMRAAKRLIAAAFAEPPTNGLALEAHMFAELFGKPEQREGMTAFIEKRKATFADPVDETEADASIPA